MFKRRLNRFLFYVFGLILVGTFGFYILGGDNWNLVDSLYMTIITLSTVGFSEVQPLNEVGKIWAMILIIFGVSGFAIIVSQFGAELIEIKRFRRRKMVNSIKRMTDHYIICGYGRMGEVIALELNEEKYSFVIIDNDDEKIAKIDELDYVYIQGDATLEDTLMAARAKDAKGIVVVLETDQDNLFVTMSVRTLNHKAFILSRCSKLDTKTKLKRAGADKVINPYVAGGHRMAELLLRPYIEDSVAVETSKKELDLQIQEINLNEIDYYDGIMIKDSQVREKYNLMIVGIIEKNGDVTVNPDPHTILNNDQTVLVIGSKESLDSFKATIPV